MLLLSRDEVRQAVSMQEAINAVEIGFSQYSLQRVTIPLRTNLRCHEAVGNVLFMPAHLHDLGGLGIKVVSVFPQNTRYGKPTLSAVLMLNSEQTGEPLVVMDATYLTALRTGAASGVATRHLARKDSKQLALIGTGGQALKQLEAILEEREIEVVYLFDLEEARARSFVDLVARELARFSFEARVARDPREAVAEADIIVTATTSREPVFPGNAIRPGTHVNGIGSYTPGMREVDEVTISRADKIVVDSYEACLEEAGDLIIPMKQGILKREAIYGEIGEVTSGKKPGRQSDGEITFFKSVGIAVQDIAVAKLAYENALQKGLGQEVAL